MKNQLKPSVSLKKLLRAYLIFLLLFVGIVGPDMLLVSWSVDSSWLASIWQPFISQDFLLYLLVGFLAQMIDGALGMAYGISSTPFLMSLGVSPAVASSSVHMAEVATTGVSGWSHWRLGNVNRQLFKRLAIPGMVGAGLGAYVLTSFDGNAVKPYVAGYLLAMGMVIIAKSFKKVVLFKKPNRIGGLALLGGFIDASGGGGWGPVVTSTLMSSGSHPRSTIGTVNAAEFLVALTASATFILSIGTYSWVVVLGLMIGGALAAPLGAYFCHKINVRAAMILVGLVIITLSVRTLGITFCWWL